VNLDFEDEVTNYGVHKIYSYPARFIPQIPRYFIEKYSPSVVCDCFGGSGTTVVEGKLHGIHSIHMDIMPISLMLAKVKTHEFSNIEFHRAFVKMEEALTHPQLGDLPEFIRSELSRNEDDEFLFPVPVQRQIQAVRTAIKSIDCNHVVKYFFSICTAQTLRRCSKAKSGTMDWTPRPGSTCDLDYIGQFRQKYTAERSNFVEFYHQHPEYINNKIPTIINTKRKWLNETIDLIVTSPPYGALEKVINYPDIHKYSHLIFSRGKKPVKSDFIQTHAQLNLYLTRVINHVRPGGHVVVVVAPCSSDNWVVGTRTILKINGLEKSAEIERIIDPRKKFIAGNIKTEWVLDYVKR